MDKDDSRVTFHDRRNVSYPIKQTRQGILENFVGGNKPRDQNQTKQNKKMKITISHDQDTIDPSATYSDEQFAEFKASLETEYEAAILKEYPEAEVDCSGTDTTYAIRVTETGMDDPSDIETDIQRICELEFILKSMRFPN